MMLLIRADARGLSGMLMASTPTDFRKVAPATSFAGLIPFGGTISTMVTNSSCASLNPMREREASSGASIADCFGFDLGATVEAALASDVRSAEHIARMCSGVVPQQP